MCTCYYCTPVTGTAIGIVMTLTADVCLSDTEIITRLLTDQEDQWIRNILNKIETKYKKSRKMLIYVVNLNSNCPAMFEFYCNVKDSDSPLLYNTFIITLYNTFIITLYNTFIAINRVIASMRESLFSLWNCFFSFIMIGVCCLFDGVITHRYTGTNYANVIYILYFLL